MTNVLGLGNADFARRNKMAETQTQAPPNAMLLTGASRGIGHATVKRFSSAGWRVITCSRHAFPEECPWMAGPQDHLQIDLADPADTKRAIAEIRERLDGGRLDALVNNAAISPKGPGGARLEHRERDADLHGQSPPAASPARLTVSTRPEPSSP